jgi:hypothetical protein
MGWWVRARMKTGAMLDMKEFNKLMEKDEDQND